ncbi:hypothetical protein ACFOD9_01450 [Novosphingobium bradum]|uniref:MarR family transcriptional regulator n=1 Tax=Novosphingobium bradum TaxID=1737444 RepID=A0ABV7IJZ0_9SPHN
MQSEAMRTNLGEWENAPFIQDQVIAYAESLGSSFILRDIYKPLRLPRYTVSRVLCRLHAKGFLTRHKIPVQLHRFDSKAGALVADGAARQCYLYALADEAT